MQARTTKRKCLFIQAILLCNIYKILWPEIWVYKSLINVLTLNEVWVRVDWWTLLPVALNWWVVFLLSTAEVWGGTLVRMRRYADRFLPAHEFLWTHVDDHLYLEYTADTPATSIMSVENRWWPLHHCNNIVTNILLNHDPSSQENDKIQYKSAATTYYTVVISGEVIW